MSTPWRTLRPIEPEQFTAPPKKSGKPRKLTDAQAEELRALVKVRHALSNKRLAARFGISRFTVTNYIRGKHKECS